MIINKVRILIIKDLDKEKIDNKKIKMMMMKIKDHNKISLINSETCSVEKKKKKSFYFINIMYLQ